MGQETNDIVTIYKYFVVPGEPNTRIIVKVTGKTKERSDTMFRWIHFFNCFCIKEADEAGKN